MPTTHDDFEDSTPNPHLVLKDSKAEVQLQRAKYKAVVAREREQAKAAQHAATIAQKTRRFEARYELKLATLKQSAAERGRAHIAVAGPFYLLVLVSGFLILLAQGSIPQDQISIASVLLTTLVGMIGSNLRSVLSEGGPEDNGNGKSKPKTDGSKPDEQKPKPKP